MTDADEWWDGMSPNQKNEVWVTHHEQQKSLAAATGSVVWHDARETKPETYTRVLVCLSYADDAVDIGMWCKDDKYLTQGWLDTSLDKFPGDLEVRLWAEIPFPQNAAALLPGGTETTERSVE